MKSPKAFWISILLLVVLGLGGCMELATQQGGSAPAGEEQPAEKGD